MLFVESRAPAALAAGIFSRHQRSRFVSSMMLSLFLPALNAATSAQDRANTELQLTQLAAALAVYRAEHGAYPVTLDDLVSSTLEKLPFELYNSKPFLYKRIDEGYLLYSAGENGTDDGGNHEQGKVLQGRRVDERGDNDTQNLLSKIPAGADDIAIRVPRPPFELPKFALPTQ
jgi:type II secretory pathway pseudopilin PulG